jgi:DNA-3-methyladenine glycosylase
MDRLASPLPRSFYDRPTDRVARDLLGCLIAHDDRGVLRLGRIVETEAYLGVRDRACHSSRGRTPRTEVMFGPPGFAYVYLCYGMHHCLNAVTRETGLAEAVLIRAVEPLEGCLGEADGPGKVCRALGVDRRLNGADLLGDALRIVCGERAPRQVCRGPRVGVDYAGAWARRRLRFWEKGSPFVSRAMGARGPGRAVPAMV